MIRTLALAAMAAMGLLLVPGHQGAAAAAPTIAPRIAAPDSAAEQVRYRGRVYRGGRVYAFRGPRYRGAFIYPRYRYAYPRRYYRYGRYYRPRVVIGAGLPFFYGGYGYYSGCGSYYRKWRHTGSRYWRNRYYACRWW